MLKIENLTKVYSSGKRAVDGLSLEVAAGDIYGFIGRNGAGKTTTLKAVAGIHDFEGEIWVDGKSVRDEPVACKAVTAYIPDQPDVYGFMKGGKFLNFVADMYGVPLAERRERIDDYAARFELTGALSSQVSTYSHGMRQKLVLISALIHKPKLLLLDEPFVGLDPTAAFKLKEIMREMTAGGGAIFFSTHVLDVAQKLCNKVAIIRDGRLVLQGAIDDVVGSKSLEDVFFDVN